MMSLSLQQLQLLLPWRLFLSEEAKPTSLQHSVVAAVVACIVASMVVVVWRFLVGGKRKEFAHLSGPRPLPLVGNLVELLRDGFPKAHRRWVDRYGDVFKCYMGCNEYLVVVDPDLIKEVFVKKFKSFPNRPVIEWVSKRDLQGVIFSRDAYWCAMRSAVMPLFHTDMLRNYACHMDDCARLLSQRLEQASKTGERIRFQDYVEAMTLDVFGRAAFGMDFGLLQGNDKAADFVEAIRERVALTGTASISAVTSLLLGSWVQFPLQSVLSHIPGTVEWHDRRNADRINRASQHMLELNQKAEVLRRTKEAAEDMHAATPAAAEGKQAPIPAAGARDLLSVLSSAKLRGSGDGLTVAKVVAELIVAGYETTATAITFAVMLLAANPEVEAKMVREIEDKYEGQPLTVEGLKEFPYVEMVVKEALRMFPVGAMHMREAAEDTTLGTISVPKKTYVLVPTFALHHRRELFKDPDVCRPERFDLSTEEGRSMHPFAYIPFGAGPRMCPGYKFGMQEACIALIHMYSKLSFRFADEAFSSLVEREKSVANAPIKAGIVIQPSGGLWVHVVQHRRNGEEPSNGKDGRS